MHYKQRQVELKSAELFQSKMIREHMAASKKKSHDCLEAALHCFGIEPCVGGICCCFFSVFIFLSSPLLQQAKKIGRMFIKTNICLIHKILAVLLF